MKLVEVFQAARAEYHWFIIGKCKKRMKYLFEKGESLSSERLLKLNSRVSEHGIVAFEIDDWFLKRMQ